MAGKVKGTLRRVAVGIIKEYAPGYASKFILEAVRNYSFSELSQFAEQRRNLFLERWNTLSPGKRQKIRNFLSHVEKQVRPVFGNAEMIRDWLGKEAKRIKEKAVKTRDDYVEVGYINFMLNSPAVFSWVCWLSKEAGDIIFGGEEPPRSTVHLELAEETADAEKASEPAPEEKEPETPPQAEAEEAPYGIISGE